MLPLLAPAAAAVGLVILQSTLLGGLQLDLLTPVLVYVALDSKLGAAVGFAVGLGFLCDTISGLFGGLNVGLNLGVVLLARGLRGHLLLGSTAVRAAAAGVCLLARGVLFLGLAGLLGWPLGAGHTALAVLLQAAAGAAASLPLFALLDRAMESLALRQQPL